MPKFRLRSRGWLLTFLVMAIAIFVAVDYLTGQEVIGAAVRFVWNGIAYVANALIRVSGELIGAVARTIGMRRMGRLASVMAGVGLGYAGSVILSDAKLHKAQGWRGKLRAAITITRNKWLELHLVWKLCIVAVLIASQVYLHWLLIVFPIAFLVPVVRRAWAFAVDQLLGSWYRKRMLRAHRAMVAMLRKTPGYGPTVRAARLVRMRYLCAWRVWRYDRRYRNPETGHHIVSLVEPVRLWWRGDLDHYIQHPLLGCKPRHPRATPTSRLR